MALYVEKMTGKENLLEQRKNSATLLSRR